MAFYGIAILLYDNDTRYILYVRYPEEMYYLDLFTNYCALKYRSVLMRLPFQGNIPMIDSPEKYHQFKKELKEYFFNIERKKKLREKYNEILHDSSLGKPRLTFFGTN